MAIAFDAASSGSAVSGTSVTFSHTCTGSNLLLVVGVVDDSNGFRTFSCTYNGVAMTELYDQAHATSNVTLAVFVLVAPATGAHDVVITASGTTDMVGGAVSFTGVHQSSPHDSVDVIGTANTGSSSNDVTSATGDVVVDIVGVNQGVPTGATAGGGQTERVDLTVTGLDTILLAMSHEDGAGTVTMSWTFAGAVTSVMDSTHAGLNLNPAVVSERRFLLH